MSKYKFIIPTTEQAKNHVIHNKSNPLDQFIYIIQPEIDKNSITIFREHLENALQYVINLQDSFELTLDETELDTTPASPDKVWDLCKNCGRSDCLGC